MVRRAFTLVELLVVISIIGVLIGLLLPAVNMAREAGRKAQCTNNLKQLGYGCLQHDVAQGYYPSGGWGYGWVGDSNLGYGNRQPGSWVFSILTYLDQEPLYRLGFIDVTLGKTADQQYNPANFPQQMSGASQCMSTPVPGMNCPTRRRSITYPCTGYTPINANAAANVARSDYAANAGNIGDKALQWLGPTSAGPTLTSTCTTNWIYYYTQNSQSLVYQFNTSTGAFGPSSVTAEPNGVIYTGSQVRKDDITDGTSNTYMLGEKYLVPENYTNYSNTTDKSDVYCMYSGCTLDNERTTYQSTPLQDRSKMVVQDAFGSAHANSCCFVFCDGSTHWVNYNINPAMHQLLGARNDSQPIDVSGL
jgi:prepilin-type N-terminal cleavage/methylation domain-containing protein